MKHRWHQLRDKFDGLTARERGLIGAATLAILAMIFLMPLESMLAEHTKLSREIDSVSRENQVSDQQIAMYQSRLAEDPNAPFRQRLDNLQQQLTDVELRLESHNVVPSNVMPALLNTMMASAKGVTVTGFESMPPKPLLSGDAESKINLYSHGAKLNIQGKYFDVLRFLQTVEKLPQKVYWKQLDYQVKEYPLAQVSLEFYTLSVNEEYISVAY
ncbi:MSHA biogenesis protein MshJ [Shewanella sp. GXUN23E]|uniref:MSHA biogenesis protein MshJ n=1 Tax=Shewanella sp. GXUN23E TaxID=3422498 RepID=UPI003D7C73FC